MTNNLKERLYWHRNPDVIDRHFSTKYRCYYLIYYEHYQEVEEAINREKQLKGWRREKEENLIKEFNPTWEFLNDKI